MTTLKEILDLFFHDLHLRRVSPHTTKAYKLDLNDFISLFASEKSEGDETESLFESVVNCTSVDLNHYLGYLGKSEVSTIARKFSSVRKFLGWAHKNGHRRKVVPDLPWNMPTQQKLAPKWLTKSQVDKLLGCAEKQDGSNSSRNLVIIQLLLHTGLRVSELVALKWEDITINRYDGVLVVISGKGGKKRIIPLNSKIRTVLSKHKKYMDKKHNNEEYLFFGTRGKINSDAVLRMFYALNKILSFKVTPHNLRHTFCKTLLAKGVDMSEIATMAGHSSLNVTQKYVTPSLADTAVSVEKLIDF